MFSTIVKTLANIFLPHYCLLCKLEPTTFGLCTACESNLPWQLISCPKCATAMTAATICGRCLTHDFAYDRIIAPLRYESTLRYLITQLKFHQQLACAHLFSTLIIKALQRDQNLIKPEILLAVPLHAQRSCHRGFNQALEIAKPLAAALKIPIQRNLLYKKQASLPQSDLNFKQRETNLNNVFALRYPIKYSHVGLVDDVVTTGSTVNEIAKLLKTHGVERVSVFAVARTSLK